MSDERTWTSITRCRGCHEGRLEVILEMDPMPLVAIARTRAAASASPRVPYTLVRCRECGLAQTLQDIPDPALFRTYHYASSSIASVGEHFTELATRLIGERAGRDTAVLEIGCNDGVLLRRLPSAWRRVGVDPSDIAARAVDGTYELVNDFFSSQWADSHRGQYDLVLTSNSLAHMSDLGDALLGIAKVLRPEGEAWIEVHDLAAVMAGQWDVLYHEHKAYWSRGSLERCAERAGLHLLSAETLPLHGGLLRVRLRRATNSTRLERPDTERFRQLTEAYSSRERTPTVLAIRDMTRHGRHLAAYGASERGMVWINQVRGVAPSYVVDDSSARIGGYLSGTGSPVVDARAFRDGPPDACLITAWTYAGFIKERHPWFQGTWLTTLEPSRAMARAT